MDKKIKSIAELLTEGEKKLKESGNQRAAEESILLLSYLLNRRKFDLFFNRSLPVPSTKVHQYFQWLEKRVKGLPIQYITGFQNFMGLEFKMTEGVFIPRPETEILVEEVINLIDSMQNKRELYFLDIGVGSGVIPITICRHFQKKFKNIFFYAIDISRKAIELSKKNAKRFHCENRVSFYQGDLFLALQNHNPPIVFDGIISNPPYISLDEWYELPGEICYHEPIKALLGGEEGLNFYRKIICESRQYLQKENGFLALEIGHKQKDAVCGMISRNSFFKDKVVTFCDYYQNNRGIIAFTGTRDKEKHGEES